MRVGGYERGVGAAVELCYCSSFAELNMSRISSHRQLTGDIDTPLATRPCPPAAPAPPLPL